MRNNPLTTEYGKAIVFDYSYRYFYGDGYGKDFRVINLRDETDEDKTELLLWATCFRCSQEGSQTIQLFVSTCVCTALGYRSALAGMLRAMGGVVHENEKLLPRRLDKTALLRL